MLKKSFDDRQPTGEMLTRIAVGCATAFVLAAMLGNQPVAARLALTCIKPPVEPCFRIHGRLSTQMGRPLVIWWIDTTRRLDVQNEAADFLPTAVVPYLEITSPRWSYVYGDFEVCPIEPDVPGHMRSVCVAEANNLVVQGVTNHVPPFHVWSTWKFAFEHERQPPENGPIGLTCDATDDAVKNAKFELGVGTVQLHDGVGNIPLPDRPDEVDWAVDVKEVSRFGPSRRFLLIDVTTDHKSGTGAADSLFVYTCRRNRMTRVFWAKKEYGADVWTTTDGFTVQSGAWVESDPHCCPSLTRTEHFTWNQQQESFSRASNRLQQRPPR